MLKLCSEKEFDAYLDFVYGLAMDPAKSGYPIYSDGIKTKKQFIDQAREALSKETAELLLFEYEGCVEGWVQYEWIPADHYMSTSAFNIAFHTEVALQEFLDYVQDRFQGYDLFLGFSGANEKAVNFLSDHGFECIENTFHHTLDLRSYQPVLRDDHVVRIKHDNYTLFAELHDQNEGYMYWKSTRIRDTLEHWVVFVKLEDGKPVGNVYYRTHNDGVFSLYGLDQRDNRFCPQVFCDLMNNALRAAVEMGGKYMTCFCEKVEVDSMRELGFTFVAEYFAFQKQL